MDITAQQKIEVQNQIVEAVIFALENSVLHETDLPDIGKFVLDRIDNIKSQEELVSFLSEMSTKWPVFKNIEINAKNKSVAEKVTDLTNNGQLDQAIDLAKSITEK